MNKIKHLNMQVNLKSFCNLRCDYCALPVENRNQSSYDDEGLLLKNLTTLFQKCIDENYVVSIFTLFGAEPLVIKPEVIGAVFNKVCKTFPNVKIKIQTNAVLLTPEYLDKLMNTLESEYTDRLELRVSIDGVKAIHDDHRDNSFDKANSNMIYAKQNSPFDIIAMSTTSPEHFNVKEYEIEFLEWISYIQSLGIKFLLSFVDNRIAGISDIHIGNEECVDDFGEFLIKNDLIRNSNKFFNMGFCYRDGNDCDKTLFDISNGSVHQCERGFGIEDPIGNFLTDNIFDIMSSRKALVHNELLANECDKCDYLAFCKGGCPLSRDEYGLTNQCGIIKKILGYLKSNGINYWDYFSGPNTIAEITKRRDDGI